MLAQSSTARETTMEQPKLTATATTSRDPRVTEALARETAQPTSVVQRVYDEEIGKLARTARITQFLSVLAARRARQRLRKHG